MNKHLELVKDFHLKFNVPVLDKASLIPRDRSVNRHKLMADEVAEYLKGVEDRDIENIAKELADVLYVVYGSILEHGLQDKMDSIFQEVHDSNMSKDIHEYKMIKGEKYFKADLKKFFSQ
jgi:predicted HAD superfamily Cof-like phosphohydrolase